MRRRDLCFIVGLFLLLVTISAFSFAEDVNGGKTILCFDLATIFEHEPAQIDGEGSSFFARMIAEFAAEYGLDVEYTKDGSVFEKDLSGYVGFAFYTCDDLSEPKEGQIPVTPEGEKNLLDAVRKGAGFFAIHSSVWTWARGHRETKFHSPFNRMLGAGVVGHGNPQETEVFPTEPVELPSLKKRDGKSFRHFEEWYSLYDFNPDIHVLLIQETKGMAKEGGDAVYDRAPFPCAWIRREGEGRVAYASFGHDIEKLSDAPVPEILFDLFSFTIGKLDLDTFPNFHEVCPDAD